MVSLFEEEHLLELLARMELKGSQKPVAEGLTSKRETTENLEGALEKPSLSENHPAEDPSDAEIFSFVSYAVHGEHLLGLPITYATFFYGEQPAASPPAYQLQAGEAEEVVDDAPAEEIMTAEEGAEVVQEAQYAVLTTGNTYDMDPDTLRQLDLQIKLDPSFLVLLMIDAVTRDVNYAPWV